MLLSCVCQRDEVLCFWQWAVTSSDQHCSITVMNWCVHMQFLWVFSSVCIRPSWNDVLASAILSFSMPLACVVLALRRLVLTLLLPHCRNTAAKRPGPLLSKPYHTSISTRYSAFKTKQIFRCVCSTRGFASRTHCWSAFSDLSSMCLMS